MAMMAAEDCTHRVSTVPITRKNSEETSFLEGRKTEEEETDTEQELAQHALLVQVHENDTDEERRVDEVRDVEREPEAHDPCRYRRTDVGAEDNRDGLHERKEPRINKRDRHQRGGGRTLYRGCNEHAGEHSRETVRGHGSEHMSELRTGHFLQSLAHGLHTEHEQG